MTPDEMLTRVRELWKLLQRERETSKRYKALAREIRHLADAYKAAELEEVAGDERHSADALHSAHGKRRRLRDRTAR